ncbi:Integrase, catalytic core protein [Phytophthora megakarya]|uniref:Integrase, catalytic core protein n=1 Tax=Phytophthora megakarya TaxID=4795 RepID=A0A225VEU2_9STRA|nr:Integrase, catalytic core protein [Phytophthora megakarya]
MDTYEPMRTLGVYGTAGLIRYFLSIIDDQKSWRWTFVLRKKTELEREGKFTIKRIRSDGGTEFVKAALKTFCTDMRTSNPYTPEANGAAERDHQAKLGKVRFALRDANLPAKW